MIFFATGIAVRMCGLKGSWINPDMSPCIMPQLYEIGDEVGVEAHQQQDQMGPWFDVRLFRFEKKRIHYFL